MAENEMTGNGFKQTIEGLLKDEKLLKMTDGLFCVAILGGSNPAGEARIILEFSSEKILAEKKTLTEEIIRQMETKNEKDNIPSA